MSLYAVVLVGLWSVGASPWVILAVAFVVTLPAVRHRAFVRRRVHLGVGSSIILEFVLWWMYGPVAGLEYVPIVSVSVAALVLSRRAALTTWVGAVSLQAVAVFVAAMDMGFSRNVLTGEIVALVLLVMVGPAFRGIAAVLSELRDELAERVKEQTRLTEIVAEKDRFLEGAAHTLRTPLTGVLGLAEVVDSGTVDPDEQRDLVRTVVSEGRRLVRAIDNVIVGSRLPMGRVELVNRPVDLAAAAEAVAAGRATVAGSGTGVGDPARLMTVIGNLIDNADSHGRPPITVSVWEDPVRAWFEVADSGPGIADSDREAVFGRYDTRTEDPTQPAPMGLGLPVSRDLVRLMGGDLECEGSRFVGWLPRARVPVESVGG